MLNLYTVSTESLIFCSFLSYFIICSSICCIIILSLDIHFTAFSVISFFWSTVISLPFRSIIDSLIENGLYLLLINASKVESPGWKFSSIVLWTWFSEKSDRISKLFVSIFVDFDTWPPLISGGISRSLADASWKLYLIFSKSISIIDSFLAQQYETPIVCLFLKL